MTENIDKSMNPTEIKTDTSANKAWVPLKKRWFSWQEPLDVQSGKIYMPSEAAKSESNSQLPKKNKHGK